MSNGGEPGHELDAVSEIARDHERYQAFFESAPDPFVVTLGTGRITDLNERARSVFGTDMVGQAIVDLVHEDDRGDFDAAQAHLGEEPRHAVTLCCDTGDGPRHYEFHMHELADERRLWLLRDVTGGHELQRSLAAAAQQERAIAQRLRSLDQLRRAFLLAVAHDLRSPLAAIVGLADLLANPDLPTEVRLRTRDDLRATAQQVANDFDDLLDLERIDADDLTVERRSVDVGELLADVTSTIDAGTRHLHVDAPAMRASVDPTLLARIAFNLLRNAVDHTPPETNVWLHCRTEGDDLILVVEDDGPGIRPERRQSIFDLFSGGRPEGGRGVGLYLVRRFAELHGGEVVLDLREHAGASFRVRLPSPSEHPGTRPW